MLFLLLFFMFKFLSEVESLIYLEDKCTANSSQILTSFSSGQLKATQETFYSVGKNCSLVISSPYKIIVSVKKINFRPGCKDYLKITDKSKQIALCGTKNELDSNMQFYGKNIFINYFTEDGGSNPNGFSGFHLTYTAGEETSKCDKRYKFPCENGYCISNYFICNGDNNCGDFSDEKACSRSGIVIFIAMFLVSVMGLVGGFCISMGVVAVYTSGIFRLDYSRNTMNQSSSRERAESSRF